MVLAFSSLKSCKKSSLGLSNLVVPTTGDGLKDGSVGMFPATLESKIFSITVDSGDFKLYA